jgi:hypothetical protein
MNMLSVEPFCKFTICSCCAWKKLCLTTSKIVFDNKQIVLSKNCVWRQTKLYLKTNKFYCQKIVFDDKQNCIWQQANCIVKKLCLKTKKNCIWKQANCIVEKLCLTTSKIVFDNKQIVLLSWVPHPQRSVELKTPAMSFRGCQSVHGLHNLSWETYIFKLIRPTW